MSSNDIVGLINPFNDFDLVGKKYVNNYDDDNFKKELIKVLKEISERLYFIKITIENKL